MCTNDALTGKENGCTYPHTLHIIPASKNALSAGTMSVCRSKLTASLVAMESRDLCAMAADRVA